jgi:hypothetical protein
MEELKKILSNEIASIDNQKLQDYVQGNLPKQEEHALEVNIGADEFLNDAIEGLKESNTQNLDFTIYEINNKVKKRLKLKTVQKKKKLISENLVLLAILLTLGLIILGYIIIRKHLNQ